MLSYSFLVAFGGRPEVPGRCHFVGDASAPDSPVSSQLWLVADVLLFLIGDTVISLCICVFVWLFVFCIVTAFTVLCFSYVFCPGSPGCVLLILLCSRFFLT